MTNPARSLAIALFASCCFGCASGAPVATDDAAPPTPVTPDAAAALPPAENDDEITGRCELTMDGHEIRPCDGVSLMVRSRDGRGAPEERKAEIQGYNFRFTKLGRRSYVLTAASSTFDVQTDVKSELSPGQTLKIRVRANPRL